MGVFDVMEITKADLLSIIFKLIRVYFLTALSLCSLCISVVLVMPFTFSFSFSNDIDLLLVLVLVTILIYF